jgi:hypothetical protein
VPRARELLDRARIHEAVGAGAHADAFVSEVVRNLNERDAHA